MWLLRVLFLCSILLHFIESCHANLWGRLSDAQSAILTLLKKKRSPPGEKLGRDYLLKSDWEVYLSQCPDCQRLLSSNYPKPRRSSDHHYYETKSRHLPYEPISTVVRECVRNASAFTNKQLPEGGAVFSNPIDAIHSAPFVPENLKPMAVPLANLVSGKRSLRLMCGASAQEEGYHFVDPSGSAIGMAVPENVGSGPFAQLVLSALPEAVAFWNQKTDQSEATARRIIRDALSQACPRNEDVKTPSHLSLGAVYLDEKFLHASVIGRNLDFYVFRRSERDRYARSVVARSTGEVAPDDWAFQSDIDCDGALNDDLFTFPVETDDLLVLTSSFVPNHAYLSELSKLVSTFVSPGDSYFMHIAAESGLYPPEFTDKHFATHLAGLGYSAHTKETDIRVASTLRYTTPPSVAADLLVSYANCTDRVDSRYSPVHLQQLVAGSPPRFPQESELVPPTVVACWIAPEVFEEDNEDYDIFDQDV